jgi:hypothetical protein
VTDPTVAALWVDLLGRLAGPAGHAVNNALNNVAINLAVVQSRPGATEFAGRADEYLTEAARMTRAVLALARPVPTPVEPASVVHQLVLVLAATGRRIEILDEQMGRTVTTTVDGTAVRLAVACALMGDAVTQVHVRGEEVRIEGAALEDDVVAAVRRAAVALRVEPGQVTFTFSGVAIPA